MKVKKRALFPVLLKLQQYLILLFQTDNILQCFMLCALRLKLKSPFTQSDSESIRCLIQTLVVKHTFGCQ